MLGIMQSECQCRTTGYTFPNCLALSKLRETQQRGQPAIRTEPVARFHQGGGFQPATGFAQSQHNFLPIGSVAIRRHQGLLNGELATGGPNGFQIA
jgi:hypothetical protein